MCNLHWEAVGAGRVQKVSMNGRMDSGCACGEGRDATHQEDGPRAVQAVGRGAHCGVRAVAAGYGLWGAGCGRGVRAEANGGKGIRELCVQPAASGKKSPGCADQCAALERKSKSCADRERWSERKSSSCADQRAALERETGSCAHGAPRLERETGSCARSKPVAERKSSSCAS